MTDTKITKHATRTDAICAIMGEIDKLPRSLKNKHGGYDYAGIDDFLDAVRPLCAKNGLVIHQREESYEILGGEDDRRMLAMTFAFFLEFNDEEKPDGKMTAFANAKMGAQAIGAARSYAMKSYQRGLFQISTGDLVEEEGSTDQVQLPPKNAKDENWHGPLLTGKLKTKMREYVDLLEVAGTMAELESIGETLGAQPSDIPKDHQFEWPAGMTWNQIIEQAEHDKPGWISGEGMPEQFIPINSHMDAALDRVGANGGEE